MKKIFSFIFVFIFSIFISFAELVSSQKFNYTIDFPDGFEMLDGTEDESMFLFGCEFIPVQILLKASSSSSAKDFLTESLNKLSAKSNIESVNWRRRECFFASFYMQNAVFKEEQVGYSICVPLSIKDTFLSVIVFSPKNQFKKCENVMLSILDSVMIDSGSFKEAGIVTSKKYPSNSKDSIPIELSISDEKVFTQINQNDSQANQYVIDREFDVFKIYAMSNNPKIFQYSISAWQRFYRIIAKDSLGRLKRVSFDIYNSLVEKCENLDKQNPEAAFSQILLNWVQNFEYKRVSNDETKADFSDLISVLLNKGSDCDSRSMLVSVILKNMGIDSCIFVSSEYSHALLGVVLEGKLGQSIEIDQKKYLLGDTTIKGATFGTIDASQADKTKWIGVEYPF